MGTDSAANRVISGRTWADFCHALERAGNVCRAHLVEKSAYHDTREMVGSAHFAV